MDAGLTGPFPPPGPRPPGPSHGDGQGRTCAPLPGGESHGAAARAAGMGAAVAGMAEPRELPASAVLSDPLARLV